MANRKKDVYKVKPMTEGKRNIIRGLLEEYDIETAEDIQAALRDLLGGTINVGGKINLPPHGKEIFHLTVSSFLHLPVRTFFITR